MMVPDPSLGPRAWRRRITGSRGYSLCGVNHAIASDTIMDGLGELLTAPVQTWDAVICTSHAAKATIERLLDNWGDYLNRRTGGRIKPAFQLPVIPLGVDCDAFAGGDQAAAERLAIRRGLGIGEDDVAVLFMGRLSFHAKAHPTPLYLSLEEAAKRGGKRLHLIQAGWFANEGIEREFREGVRAYAPSVNPIFLDGREPDVRFKVWFAADIFTSLSDNIQETFGMTPVEAMAAGLPAVVSDWDGYRDTVRPGVDGFTIPTWMPLPQSGGDLALAPESRIGGATPEGAFDQYLGHVSQFTAVDVAAAADAFATLAGDEALRRRMGEAGRRRARETFDWRVVVAAYQGLWRDLENIRNRDSEIAPATVDRPAVPLRDDPFSLFSAYPSGTIDGDTVVALTEAEGGWGARLEAVGRRLMNIFAAGAMLGEDDQRAILGKLEKEGPLDVYGLAELLPDERRYMLTRTVAWLAKVGIDGLEPGKGRRKKGERGRALDGRPTSAMVELGIAARARGAFGPATRYFERALENDPDDPVANNQLAELMAYAGRLADARQHFARAADKAPDYQPPHRNLGRVLFLEGDYGAAREALDRARELKPDDAETTYLLGVCCRYAGGPKDARVHLEDSLALDDGRADAAAHLGLVHKSLGHAAEARRAFRRALDKDPGNVLAGAALMSLEAEDAGRRALSKGGKRVGLFVHAKFHFPLLKPLFEALAGGHWPLVSADALDLADFEPAATLICDAPVNRLRRLVPGTTTVNVRQGLAGRNFARRTSRHADFVCVTSAAMRDELVAAGALPENRIWVTGFAPNDALF
ncbi:MAG: tetratricopeptide repeat protein, partial [Rhodospirillales bacterium]